MTAGPGAGGGNGARFVRRATAARGGGHHTRKNAQCSALRMHILVSAISGYGGLDWIRGLSDRIGLYIVDILIRIVSSNLRGTLSSHFPYSARRSVVCGLNRSNINMCEVQYRPVPVLSENARYGSGIARGKTGSLP